MNSSAIISQDKLILNKLMEFYSKDDNLLKMLNIINGKTKISLRIVDWFVTNYAKKNYTIINHGKERFKVHFGYKQQLKAYNKKRFDPFCRWDRITVPYDEHTLIETTIGQLNFFKWALDKHIIQYIEEHYNEIEIDMMTRNSISKKFKHPPTISHSSEDDADEKELGNDAENDSKLQETYGTQEPGTENTIPLTGKNNAHTKTRKKREELSISAIKSIKKETVEIVLNFN